MCVSTKVTQNWKAAFYSVSFSSAHASTLLVTSPKMFLKTERKGTQETQ